MSSHTEASAWLPRRPLGATGLQVTPLCIGCAPLGNMPETFAYEVPEERALQTIRAVFASPINFLDTAAAYGDGESERRIGIVLRELGGLPAGFVLATKADRNLQTGEFSGPQMRRSVERSLRLLGLERLQLVYLHDPEYIPDPQRDPFEVMMEPGGPVEVLLQLKEEGLIEHLGIAGGPLDMMSRFVETGLFEAAISHNRYTLLRRDADRFWELCRSRGVATVNAAPYGSGLLAKGPEAYPRYMYGAAGEELLRRARRMQEACERYGVPLAAAALQFSLRDQRIVSTIVGVTRPERVEETLQLAQLPIPEALWSELDEIYRA
jgi:D-threo-aldose 1-dehydrogenase